jgi:hypothetical protein
MPLYCLKRDSGVAYTAAIKNDNGFMVIYVRKRNNFIEVACI